MKITGWFGWSAAMLVLGCVWQPALGAESAAPSQGEPETGALYEQISRLDTAMFNAFNAHDLGALMAMFSERLEFYHDRGGLQSFDDVEKGFKSLFDRRDGLRRELVKGSLEVFPIHGYGAIEIAEHRFCHQESGREDCGTFRFLHIWQQQGESWQVTRVVSYGH